MPLCLAFATAKEYHAALAGLGAPVAPEIGRAAVWRFRGRDILLLATGVGPVAAALALGRLLGGTRLAGVVNLGLAGSFDLLAAPMTSLFAVGLEIYPEYGLAGEAGIDPRGLRFPQAEIGDRPVFDRLPLDPADAAARMGIALPAGCGAAGSLTVAGVTGTAARAKALHEAHGALLENMEGFALALGCAQAGVPLLELRAVSNRVGSRDKADWDIPGALAALGRATASLLA